MGRCCVGWIKKEPEVPRRRSAEAREHLRCHRKGAHWNPMQGWLESYANEAIVDGQTDCRLGTFYCIPRVMEESGDFNQMSEVVRKCLQKSWWQANATFGPHQALFLLLTPGKISASDV